MTSVGYHVCRIPAWVSSSSRCALATNHVTIPCVCTIQGVATRLLNLLDSGLRNDGLRSDFNLILDSGLRRNDERRLGLNSLCRNDERRFGFNRLRPKNEHRLAANITLTACQCVTAHTHFSQRVSSYIQGSIKYPAANRGRHLMQLLEQITGVVGFHVDDDIAKLIPGLQVLRGNIGAAG